MQKNLFDIIDFRYVFNLYYEKRMLIFFIVICLCLIIDSVILIHNKYSNNKSQKYVIIFEKSVLKLTVMSFVGMIIQYIGFETKFKVTYMPLLIFSLTLILILTSCLFDCFIFRKTKLKVIHHCLSYCSVLILFVLLLLGLMNRLEIIEYLVSLVLYVTSEFIQTYILYISEDTINSNNEKNITSIDSPTVILFPSRMKQLNQFSEMITIEKEYEPFAIMISGAWGYGKTSFIDAFIRNNSMHEFIKVKGGFEFEAEKFLDDIAIQLENIFEKNNIFTGRNSTIRKYFASLGNLIGEAGYEFPSNIIKSITDTEKKGYYKNKDILNHDLVNFYTSTQKRIFIIIDDLDRCTENFKNKMFGVIRESVELKNCITIFLADSLKTEFLDYNYMEKYINKKIKLCPVEFNEIIENYINDIFDSNFYLDKSDYIY